MNMVFNNLTAVMGIAWCEKHQKEYPLLYLSECPICSSERLMKLIDEAHKKAEFSTLHFGEDMLTEDEKNKLKQNDDKIFRKIKPKGK